MAEIIKKNIFTFLLILSIFLFDRVSKLIIINLESLYGIKNYPLTSFLNFELIWNDGIAFGLLSFNNEFYYNIITLIIIVITLIIFFMMINSFGIQKYGFMMVFSGSLGNVFDRLYYSSVPDFIDIHFNNFHWFIFNVADIFISLGVIILICSEFKKKHMIKIFFIFIISTFLLGCQNIKDGLTLQKQSNADEFLVKKKNPLVLPPEFNELPTPTDNMKKKSETSTGDDIKKLLDKDNVLTSTSKVDGKSF